MAVEMDEFLRKRHSVTKLIVHLVFTTKYRRKVMNAQVLATVIDTVRETAIKIGCEPIEINGEADHLHILISFTPNHSIASIVNSLKTVSSRVVRKEFPGILTGNHTGLFWSRSYFAATAGGVTIDILRQYVESQGTKERKSPSAASHPRPERARVSRRKS